MKVNTNGQLITNTELIKFFRIGIPGLDIDEKYQNILSNYGREVETISKIYSRQRTDPVIPRNTPPTAGKCYSISKAIK